MNDLPFNWNVFILFHLSFFGNVFDLFFWDVLGDVLSKILDSIVISDGNFPRNFFDSDFFSVFGDFSCLGNSFDSSFILVFNDFFLEGNVFDSALTLNDFLSSINNGIHNLGLLGNCCV